MSLVNIDAGSIVKSVGDLIDDLITSDEERLEYKLKEKEIDQKVTLAQIEVNKEEAKSSNFLTNSWRPMIGHIGWMSLSYKFILYPLIIWIWVLLQSQDLIDKSINPPPVIDASELYPIILGMLGLGGYRSLEKIKKVTK